MDIKINNEDPNKRIVNNELPSNMNKSINTKIPLVIRMIKKDDSTNSVISANNQTTSSIIEPKVETIGKASASSTKLVKLPIKPSSMTVDNTPIVKGSIIIKGPIKPILKNSTVPLITSIRTEEPETPEGSEIVIQKKKGTLCLEEGCGKRPHCNYEGQTARYCSEHKLAGMIDVTKRQCIFVGCTSKPSYNFEREKKPIYCSKHALTDMVDIMTKKCLFEGCKVSANYNFEGFTKGLYCVTHKDDGMVDITINYYEDEDCEERAYYNYVGKTAVIYCAKHKKDGMINVRVKSCIVEGCTKVPKCNVKGQTERLYCLTHKTSDMVNLSQTPCKFEGGCDFRPHFNLPGSDTGIYCKKHKEEGMIDVTCDRCEEEGCDKVPGYNFPGEKKKLYCVTHKKATMVAVGFKVCNGKDDTGQACINRARYSPLFKSIIHCLDHRLINECEKNNPKCQQKGCKEKPLWSDIGNYPKRCDNHKLDNDVNVIEMPCSSCGITDIINAETKLCNTCDAYPVFIKLRKILLEWH